VYSHVITFIFHFYNGNLLRENQLRIKELSVQLSYLIFGSKIIKYTDNKLLFSKTGYWKLLKVNTDTGAENRTIICICIQIELLTFGCFACLKAGTKWPRYELKILFTCDCLTCCLDLMGLSIGRWFFLSLFLSIFPWEFLTKVIIEMNIKCWPIHKQISLNKHCLIIFSAVKNSVLVFTYFLSEGGALIFLLVISLLDV